MISRRMIGTMLKLTDPSDVPRAHPIQLFAFKELGLTNCTGKTIVSMMRMKIPRASQKFRKCPGSTRTRAIRKGCRFSSLKIMSHPNFKSIGDYQWYYHESPVCIPDLRYSSRGKSIGQNILEPCGDTCNDWGYDHLLLTTLVLTMGSQHVHCSSAHAFMLGTRLFFEKAWSDELLCALLLAREDASTVEKYQLTLSKEV